MGKENITLASQVSLNKDSRVRVTGADVKFVQAYPEREEVYLNPENVFPVYTLFDAGSGEDSPVARVMSDADTKIMNKAARVREKYIAHLLQDPLNTTPLPGTPKA